MALSETIRATEGMISTDRLLYREYPNGAVMRWGKRMTSAERVKQVREGLRSQNLNDDNLEQDLGVETLFVNDLPPAEAEHEGIEAMTAVMENLLSRLGWKPKDVKGLYIGSSLAPLDPDTSYPKIFADKLGLTEANLYSVHGACISGGLATLDALADHKNQKQKVIVVSYEGMLRNTVGYNPNHMDIGSALVFSQAAAVMGVIPGETMTLHQVKSRNNHDVPYIFFDEEDTHLYLAANTNYETNVTPPYTIVGRQADGVRIRLPMPNDGKALSMTRQVGPFFIQGVKRLMDEFHASMPQEEWDAMRGFVIHHPNKLIFEHAVRALLRAKIMPARMMEGMTYEEALKRLKDGGLEALNMNIHPKINPFGNPPAANAMSALIENHEYIKETEQDPGPFGFINFGAGATYAAGRITAR